MADFADFLGGAGIKVFRSAAGVWKEIAAIGDRDFELQIAHHRNCGAGIFTDFLGWAGYGSSGEILAGIAITRRPFVTCYVPSPTAFFPQPPFYLRLILLKFDEVGQPWKKSPTTVTKISRLRYVCVARGHGVQAITKRKE